MTTPNLTINNAILRAQEGLGDGTVYVSGTSAVPDQTNKRFFLPDWVKIADMPAGTDDLFNGYSMRFISSGNVYHIVDWVHGTAMATTFETPAPYDTGAYELRKTLYCSDALAANPAPMACDGLPSKKFKVRAANVAFTLDVHLPNLLRNGGFEESASAPGVGWGTGAGSFGLLLTGTILGSKTVRWNGGTNGNIFQTNVGPLKKAKTYRVAVKARSADGSTATGALGVGVIRNNQSAVELYAGFDPGIITTTPTWYVSPSFSPSADCDLAWWITYFNVANIGTATAIDVDECYFWEVVPVSALLAFGHNWDGSPGVQLQGSYAPLSRTGISGGTDFIDIISPTTAAVTGSGPFRVEVSAGPQIWPIYRIMITANAAFQYEVGELLLGQSWPWAFPPDLPVDPRARNYHRTHRRALAGSRSSALHSQRRIFQGLYSRVAAADLAILDGVFREAHVDRLEPFAIYWPGESGQPDIWPPTLVQHVSDEWRLPHRTRLDPDYSFDWEEVL